MHHFARRLSIVLTLASIAMLQHAQTVAQAATVRTVALSGQPAPGTPNGTNYSGFDFRSSVLNEAGQTAFFASLTGVGVDLANNGGIWSGAAGSLALVAREGNQAPGTPSGTNYHGFFPPALNDAGQIAFTAFLTGNGVDSTNDTGILSGAAGSLALVARGGNPAPGMPSGVSYHRFGPVKLNNAGQTAFFAGLTGSGVDSTNDISIWSQGSGNLALVARSGSPAAGTPNDATYDEYFSAFALNNAGQTAFQAKLSGSGVDFTNNQGIWSEGSGTLALVAREGSPAPGTPNGVTYGGINFYSPVLNNAGQTAFLAYLYTVGLSTTDQSIWSEGSGSLALVARSGSQAPGMPNGVNFAFDFGGPVLNDAGQTAFFANLTGSGVDHTNNQSVWSEGSGSLALVARAGSQAPGTPNGVRFDSFFITAEETPALNDAGQTAFFANLTGDGVDYTNDRGIWATDRTGALQLIARTGDPLEVAPGDFRAIRDIVGGHPSEFNNLGQLAFYAFFTDDSTGIFVSDLVAVPEPASLALLALGLPLLVCRKSLRKTERRIP